MAKVKVYRWRMYDVASDDHIVSRRLGTLDGISRLGGEPILLSATEVDSEDVGGEIEGMTGRDYHSPALASFQTHVMR